MQFVYSKIGNDNIIDLLSASALLYISRIQNVEFVFFFNFRLEIFNFRLKKILKKIFFYNFSSILCQNQYHCTQVRVSHVHFGIY